MSNTKQRIISAFVMMLIVIACALVGKNGMMLLVFFGGILLIDELIHSMLKMKRNHFSYYVSVASYVGAFIFFNFIDQYQHYVQLISNAGVTLSVILILYLFMEKMESKFFIRVLRRNSYAIGLYVLIPVLSLSFLLHQKNWMKYVILLFLLNSSVDIAAWFFGKNFGKRKLWPKISPNKTMFGLFGGVISSVIISTVYVHFIFDKFLIGLLFSLTALALLAQVGDLIESKMKRQLDVKDSSNLIPGHGGIYDRVDSLIFIAPFFALVVRNFL